MTAPLEIKRCSLGTRIRNGRDVLLKHDWVQREFEVCFRNKPVAFCALGAIGHAAKNDLKFKQRMNLFDAVDEFATAVLDFSLAELNDTEGRTKEEMLDIMDVLADAADVEFGFV